MPELRWSLLALGVLFIVGLLLWERRRRGAGGDGLASGRIEADAGSGRRSRDEAADDDDDIGDAESDSDASGEAAEIGADDVARSSSRPAPLAGAGHVDRQPLRRPPLVEIVDPSVEGLEDGPDVGSLPVVSASGGPQLGAAAVERAAQWLAETQPSLQGEAPTPRPRLRLDWPEDSQRRILALRVVARTGERFTGGAVRQALQGEGFEFGDFDIFHLAIDDGRVELSAANLTKPGSFCLQRMDAESLLGLNLFAVLPGPRPPLETFERLYGVAGLLAQRLRGEVRDATGQVLSGARLAELRREAAGSEAPRTGA